MFANSFARSCLKCARGKWSRPINDSVATWSTCYWFQMNYSFVCRAGGNFISHTYWISVYRQTTVKDRQREREQKSLGHSLSNHCLVHFRWFTRNCEVALRLLLHFTFKNLNARTFISFDFAFSFTSLYPNVLITLLMNFIVTVFVARSFAFIFMFVIFLFGIPSIQNKCKL